MSSKQELFYAMRNGPPRLNEAARVVIRGVPGTGFWKGDSTVKQYFVLPKNGSKYYLKYTFLAFPVLGILGLGTPLVVIMADNNSK